VVESEALRRRAAETTETASKAQQSWDAERARLERRIRSLLPPPAKAAEAAEAAAKAAGQDEVTAAAAAVAAAAAAAAAGGNGNSSASTGAGSGGGIAGEVIEIGGGELLVQLTAELAAASKAQELGAAAIARERARLQTLAKQAQEAADRAAAQAVAAAAGSGAPPLATEGGGGEQKGACWAEREAARLRALVAEARAEAEASDAEAEADFAKLRQQIAQYEGDELREGSAGGGGAAAAAAVREGREARRQLGHAAQSEAERRAAFGAERVALRKRLAAARRAAASAKGELAKRVAAVGKDEAEWMRERAEMLQQLQTVRRLPPRADCRRSRCPAPAATNLCPPRLHCVFGCRGTARSRSVCRWHDFRLGRRRPPPLAPRGTGAARRDLGGRPGSGACVRSLLCSAPTAAVGSLTHHLVVRLLRLSLVVGLPRAAASGAGAGGSGRKPRRDGHRRTARRR
jgi:hypothetical protein